MSGSLNKAIIIGNLGNEPEIRAMQNGSEVCTMSIATSESWKDKSSGERREKTEWHRIVIFNEAIVRVARDYLHKGSKVYLEGQIQTRKWTDKNDVEHYSTEIVLQGYNAKLVLLDKSSDQPGQPATGKQSHKSQKPTRHDAAFDDELPF